MSTRDLRADRRLEVGLALLAEQRPIAAAKAIEAALDIDESYADAWFALAEARQKAGHRRKAVIAYRRYLASEPSDALGAGLRLALLGAQRQPARLPEAYVRRLFDQYAPRFDRALRERLRYDAPELLAEAVAAATPPGAPPRRVLDLGCGTGLCGPLFREGSVWLEGVDLSPAMLARARERKVYDALVAEEAERYLAAVGAPGRPAFDLIIAADVLVYLGDLGPLFRAAAKALAPGGLFAFTLEREEAEAFRLQSSQRYAHNPASVAALAAAAGFEVLRLAPASCREEAGRPVPGILTLLRRPREPLQDPGLIRSTGSRGRPQA